MAQPYIRDMHFGCEFEYTTPRDEATKFVRETVEKLYGTKSLIVRDYPRETIRNYKKWQLKEEPTSGCEISTPILCIYDIPKLTDFLKIMAKRMKAGRSDGIHVHVEVKPWVTKVQMVAAWLLFEDVIFKLFPKHRRRNEYCNRLVDELNKRQSLVAAVFEDALDSADDHHSAMSISSYDTRGTVEFRLMEGTSNAEDVANWIRFCLYFVRFAGTLDVVKALCSKMGQNSLDDLISDTGIRDEKLRKWLGRREVKYRPKRKQEKK